MSQPATIEVNPNRAPRPRPTLRQWIAERVAGVACVMVGVSALGAWNFLFDLASHFLPYYALALLLPLPWVVWSRRWMRFGVAVAALVFCGFQIVPYYLPRALPAKGERFSVVVCNILSGNDTPELVLDWLRSNPADVAVILEVTPTWVTRLETLDDVYPHRTFRAREGNFGIAVLSRRLWTTKEAVDFTSEALPSLVVDYDLAEVPLRVIATHPPPPMGATRFDLRNRHLQMVAQSCREAPARCIVAGDLNATPWCHGFRVLTRISGLTDSALGFGIHPTWPILHGCSVIPIDHVLVSPDIGVARRVVGPNIGSDHRPVIVELIAPNASTSPAASN